MKLAACLLLAAASLLLAQREGNFTIRFEPTAILQTGVQVPFEISVTDSRRNPLTQAEVKLYIETADGRERKAFVAPAVTAGVYLAKPNLNELSDLCRKPLDTEEARIAACRDMIKSGEAEVVALTLGDQGALLVTRDGVWRAGAMQIEAVSTVGAGDSFLGGMVAALAAGEPLDKAFRVAVAAGFAAVMRPGTELSHQDDIERLMPRVEIREVATA